MLCMDTQTGTMLTLGERLRVARERAGVSVNQMADLVGRHRNMVSRWEKGRADPSLRVLRIYVDATGASMEWLTAEAGAPPHFAGGDRDSGCIPGWLDVLDGGVAQLTLFGGAEPTMAAVSRLDALLYSTADRDRRYHEVPVDVDRRHALGVAA